jgi:prepilin peptidase CpaA
MAIDAAFAAWLLLPVLPICLYVAYTDLAQMKIPNRAVLALGALFLLAGPFLLPFETYLWRLGTLLAVLVLGILFNAGGLLGAGDAKFIAAAAPYVAPPDLRLILMLFMATLLAAVATHRLVRHTPLRRLAPGWESWDRGRKFPMGLALGPCLALYLLLGALSGAR